MEIIDLCLALSIFGSIPPGNLPLIIDTQEIQTFAYSQEDKKRLVYLLCSYRELADLNKDSEVKG